MRIHHLNCAALDFPEVPEALKPLPCHVLLCEADSGLVLIDAGFGVDDYLDDDRLGPGRSLIGPSKNIAFTALRQIQAMGHRADDVTDIVITHMDRDHIGGLSDFPHARVHVTTDEHTAAVLQDYDVAQSRYVPKQWAHSPKFRLHEGPGEAWRFGLTGHQVVPGITLVPMPGHTAGHAAVVVETDGNGLIVHAGDAEFDASAHGGLDADGHPFDEITFLRELEVGTALDSDAIARNRLTLSRLAHEVGVTVINSHDARLLKSLNTEAATPRTN